MAIYVFKQGDLQDDVVIAESLDAAQQEALSRRKGQEALRLELRSDVIGVPTVSWEYDDECSTWVRGAA